MRAPGRAAESRAGGRARTVGADLRWVPRLLLAVAVGVGGCDAPGAGDDGCPGWANCTFTDAWEVGADDTDVVETVFEMSHGAEPGTLQVTVDYTEVPVNEADGYTYDDAPPRILFHGIWLPERGMIVKASYVIADGT